MALIRVNCPHCQQHQGGSKNGKAPTQGIERENLNFKTRIKRLARKTICFSRSEEIHDKVIGELIEREHFQRF